MNTTTDNTPKAYFREAFRAGRDDLKRKISAILNLCNGIKDGLDDESIIAGAEMSELTAMEIFVNLCFKDTRDNVLQMIEPLANNSLIDRDNLKGIVSFNETDYRMEGETR